MCLAFLFSCKGNPRGCPNRSMKFVKKPCDARMCRGVFSYSKNPCRWYNSLQILQNDINSLCRRRTLLRHTRPPLKRDYVIEFLRFTIMKYQIVYGKTSLEFELPQGARADVIQSKFVSALPDETGGVRAALAVPIGAKPLRQSASKCKKVAIVVNDITRATPYKKILPALMDELSGVDDSRIIFFVATGTHRFNTGKELETMLGKGILGRFKIVQNDAKDIESHSFVGKTSSGNNVYIHNEYLSCDLKILTGFIEPHFFAGFSGGPKACVPGLAGIETIINNHSFKNLSNENARWAVTRANPAWEEMHDAALLAGAPFIINVALNKDKQITAVFAGNMDAAHEKGCAFVKRHAMARVESDYDIVISSNSGYPLDLNLYQSVKGMSAASQIVKKGGAIILACDCWDGIPQDGNFGQILRKNKTPQQLIDKIKNGQLKIQDSWQAYILCRICTNADVYFYSDNLSDEQIRSSFLRPCRDIKQMVIELLAKYGNQAKICILPEGPLTVPYIV
jgi:lactate racemase